MEVHDVLLGVDVFLRIQALSIRLERTASGTADLLGLFEELPQALAPDLGVGRVIVRERRHAAHGNHG